MNLLRAFGAAASGMIGIRRGKKAEEDFSQLRPWHIAVAGLTALALFVLTLVAIVSYVAG